MTGLTRCEAARALQSVLGGELTHVGGFYDKYRVTDAKRRSWSIVSDSSIIPTRRNGEAADSTYQVEMNSPVLDYEDIPLLQEVIRGLRHAHAITGPQYDCGTHIHISADDYTAQQLTNLVNIFSSKGDFLWDALQISSVRSRYCRRVDQNFVRRLNQLKPKALSGFKKIWYEQSDDPPDIHYNSTRYFMLNLHSFFQHGHYEIRAANASLHAGEVRSQIVLALAINNAAMTRKYCSPAISHSDNMRYSFRVWLLHLGLIGEEFKNCRAHLLKHLTGNCAWRHPEDAIAQRERLKERRRAAREQRECAVSSGQGSAVETAPADSEAAVDDFEEESVRMNL